MLVERTTYHDLLVWKIAMNFVFDLFLISFFNIFYLIIVLCIDAPKNSSLSFQSSHPFLSWNQVAQTEKYLPHTATYKEIPSCFFLVGGFFPNLKKYAQAKLERISPKFRVKVQKYLKPTASISLL